MITTKSGFTCTIEDKARDDFELVEAIADFTHDNNGLQIPKIGLKLLGAEKYEELKKHCTDENGFISTQKIVSELTEIMNTKDDELKK